MQKRINEAYIFLFIIIFLFFIRKNIWGRHLIFLFSATSLFWAITHRENVVYLLYLAVHSPSEKTKQDKSIAETDPGSQEISRDFDIK